MKQINRNVIIAVLIGFFTFTFSPLSTDTAVYAQEAYEHNEYYPAEQGYGDSASEAEHAPGKLIVKLHEQASLEDIQELNEKYNVSNVKRVFPDVAPPQERLDELKSKLSGLDSNHKCWYWYNDTDSQEYKDYRARIAQEKKQLSCQIETLELLIARLEQRKQNAPRNMETPQLDTIYTLECPESTDITSMAQEYDQIPSVEYAEPDYILRLFMVPDDPMYVDQWAHQTIQSEQAWDITTANNIIIAFIDSGIDYTHEDLVDNMWINSGEILGNEIDDDGNGYIDDYYGYDATGGGLDGQPYDDIGHGTHCAGIAAAVTNNATGVAGVCPNAKLMAIKLFNILGIARTEHAAQSFKYAADQGADIISNSWGSSGYSLTIKHATDYAFSRGCFVVAAAGNYDDETFRYPAAYENVVAVAATDSNDQKTSFSTYGSWVDVSAPGDSIVSTFRTQLYVIGSGTSMACPHVAGLAALIKSKYPTADPEMILSYIKGGADPIDSLNPGYEGLLGAGRINLYKSLTVEGVPVLKIKHVERNNMEPGEDASIIIHIKNVWEDASGLSATLTTNHPQATIQNDTVYFGSILSGETKDNAANPFIISLDSNITQGSVIDFSLDVRCNETEAVTSTFTAAITYFTPVGKTSGLPLNSADPKFTIMEDYDNDGYLDVFFVGPFHSEPEMLKSYLYKNLGNNSFQQVNNQANLPEDISCLATPLFLDIDNDGNKDLFMPQDTGSQLYLNNGDGTFFDITQTSGIQDIRCHNAALLDYNNDGFIDICGYVLDDPDYFSSDEEFYILKNNGNNTFTKVTAEAGVPNVGTGLPLRNIRILPFDYDNDRDQDILFLNFPRDADFENGNNIVMLFRNKGDGTFFDVTDSSNLGIIMDAVYVHSTQIYKTITIADYNNDGYQDVFFGARDMNNEVYQQYHCMLFKNNGNGTFSDVTEEAGNPGELQRGWKYGTEFFDYDNDGDVDLHINGWGVSPIHSNTLYQNNGGTFVNVTNLAIPDEIAPYDAPCAMADFNNDGSIDVYAPAPYHTLEYGALLENIAGKENNWIKIKLEGTLSNRDALGAKVFVTTAALRQLREVGSSTLTTQPVHFGVGQAATIDQIEVQWPSGNTKRLFNIGVNQTLTISEATAGNNAPVLSPIGDKEITEGEFFAFSPSADDPDSDPVTITASGLQQWMSFDGLTFAAQPSADDVGEHQIAFTASDGSSVDSETITVTVVEDSGFRVYASPSLLKPLGGYSHYVIASWIAPEEQVTPHQGIRLYKKNGCHLTYITYHATNSQTTGSCQFYGNYFDEPGTYVFRYEDWSDLEHPKVFAMSNPVIVTDDAPDLPDFMLEATPSYVATGETIFVTWLVPTLERSGWIGLYRKGAANKDYIEKISNNGAKQGGLSFTAPQEEGEYEFRYLVLNTYDDRATSNPLTVGSDPRPPEIEFTASAEAIVESQSSILTWSITNAASVSASGGWSGSKALSGSETVSPTANNLDCYRTGRKRK
ncbi:MAG: S8 family serine peptidase [Deltaproteobacteria bacterium]|nr:S8 family serine peptidase [Deltaproteobacteria bacterium]